MRCFLHRHALLRLRADVGRMACAWVLLLAARAATAQQTIGRIDAASNTQDVRVSGAITLQGNTLLLGNGSSVTAGGRTLAIHLARGGELDVCATTRVDLLQQKTASGQPGPFMLALSRGSLEMRSVADKVPDVVLTPDLRIEVAGPGKANVDIHVGPQGDACVDLMDGSAASLTISEEMGDGVARLLPGQHVLYAHGNFQTIAGHGPAACGCPDAPVVSVASAGTTSSSQTALPGEKTAPANTTPAAAPADTEFPLAVSEGRVPPPTAPARPSVAPGQTHVEVAATLTYDAQHPVAANGPGATAAPPVSGAAQGRSQKDAAHEGDATLAKTSPPANGSKDSPSTARPSTAQTPSARPPKGIFHHIRHFFARLFGKH